MPPKLLPVNINDAAHVNFLLLVMRDRLSEPNSNISHTTMPTGAQHGEYLRSKPHGKNNFIIRSGGWDAGHVYLSKDNEIGVYIRPAFRREGFATFAVREMIKIAEQRGGPILANINPANAASHALFRKAGFKEKTRSAKQVVLEKKRERPPDAPAKFPDVASSGERDVSD